MINDEKDRINQVNIKDSQLNSINILYDVCKSICKIIASNQVGTGFLIKIEKEFKPFNCLITCEHVITNKMIKSNETLEILFKNQKKKIYINLGDSDRFIKNYRYLNIDATIVQILDKDKIKDKYFLLPNLDYLNGFEQFKNKTIYIPQFPGGENLSYSTGIIKDINYYHNEFSHTASTQPGSSGSPIFLENSSLIIGIHKQGNIKKNINYANFIGPIITSLKTNFKFVKQIFENDLYEGEISDGKKEGYGKCTSKNGEIYIGQWKDNQKKGKGTLLKDNKIIYEGDFDFDTPDGFGKSYYENGNYFIGQFIDGKKHGKGILYDKNDNVIYDGEFAFDKFEGNGKYILENGDYYYGKFNEGKLSDQKVTLYDKNKNKKYEGGFINNKYEGKGTIFLDDGNYFIGLFIKGLRNGKGIFYYKDNSVLFEGNYLNDNEINGIGFLGYMNGFFYVGQTNKMIKHGKGTYYDNNKKIIQRGIFENDIFKEGYGQILFTNGNYYVGEIQNFMAHGKGTLYGINNNIINSGIFQCNRYVGLPQMNYGNTVFINSYPSTQVNVLPNINDDDSSDDDNDKKNEDNNIEYALLGMKMVYDLFNKKE